MSVARAQREISRREFLEWRILEQIEPWGARRDDWHAAMVACVVANAFRGKKGSKPFTIEDFMLKFETEPKRRKSVAQMKAMFRMMCRGG